ncbi:MAG: MBL fold metallo-hydrolase [Acidobacteria bacterium]|nr:MBL fold metallo-hydrolase [Acidobacteriota bacterium]
MKRELVLGALVIAGALSAVLAASGREQAGTPQPSASALQVDKLTDNLYVVRGGGGNTAVFVTANGVLLVDTKLPGWGKPLLEKIKELTDKPVTTIVNTHTHFDHVSGNVDFPPTVEIVAHENTARLMRDMRPPTGVPTAPRTMFEESKGVGLPKRTYKDTLTLGSGNDRVELHYFGAAHTSGDTFVVFPSARAMHAGDVFPNKGIPIVDGNNGGSGLEYANTLARAAALPDVDVVITGHNATTLTMDDLKMYIDFNRGFVETVRAAKKAGKTLDEVASTWRVPARFLDAGYSQPAGDTGQSPSRVRMNAELIWNELK